MKCYTVEYKLYAADNTKAVIVIAKNKEDAYVKAVYKVIPAVEKILPYSAWVHSVTYRNGNHKIFNTFEGNPY